MRLVRPATRERLVAGLPRWVSEQVPRDHHEPERVWARRRRVVGGVSVVGAGLLGLSLSAKPGSGRFIVLTLSVAGTWLAGGLTSGPLHLGFVQSGRGGLRRPVVLPVLTGVAAFGAFYGLARVCRRVPVLDRAIRSVLAHAQAGGLPLVVLTTLLNGASEEVFFRGAMYAAFRTEHPEVVSTAVYTLATAATRNPSLVLAAGFMGALFGWQRRISGGIQAPLLTHLTWSVLMLAFLPPLFPPDPPAAPSAGTTGPAAEPPTAPPAAGA